MTTEQEKSWRRRGKYYGYPECCIESFVTERDEDREKRKHYYTGFIPCLTCNRNIHSFADLVNLIRDRECSTMFPEEGEFDDCVYLLGTPKKWEVCHAKITLFFNKMSFISSSIDLSELKSETHKLVYVNAFLAACKKVGMSPSDVNVITDDFAKVMSEEYARLISVRTATAEFDQELWKKGIKELGIKETIVKKTHPQYEQVLQYYRDHRSSQQ